jgi:hypothetical protein
VRAPTARVRGKGGARKLSFEEIVCVKQKRSELFQQWSAVEPGASFELPFDTEAVAK